MQYNATHNMDLNFGRKFCFRTTAFLIVSVNNLLPSSAEFLYFTNICSPITM